MMDFCIDISSESSLQGEKAQSIVSTLDSVKVFKYYCNGDSSRQTKTCR